MSFLLSIYCLWWLSQYHFNKFWYKDNFRFQPEDIKEANRDILERARKNGLLGGKKKQKKVVDQEPGQVPEEKEPEEEKLLERRVKRAPRKLRQTQSYPVNFMPYTKPSATSIVRSQILSGTPKSATRATKSNPAFGIRAHAARLRPLAAPVEKREKPIKVAEHVKVVKHPAPFRWIPRSDFRMLSFQNTQMQYIFISFPHFKFPCIFDYPWSVLSV